MKVIRQAAIVLIAVLLLRLPFLNQAIQGDDPYYLKGAEHALIDPLHPSHAKYVFQGDLVDMRGHPHPPLNSWILAALLAVCGDVHEIPFHAAYIVLSLIAAWSMLAIARRFTEHALAATLLFMAVPAFVINGASLEADLPLLAFWMAAVAFTLYEQYAVAAVFALLATLTGYQAVALFVILPLLKRDRRTLIPACAAPFAVVAYNMFERITSGAVPAQVLAGYMSTYKLQTATTKIHNAVALSGHMGWLVFPALAIVAFRRQWIAGAIVAVAGAFYDPHPLFWLSCAAGVMVLAHCARNWRDPLAQWTLVFFAGALAIFFAGSARYLLPIAAPVILMVAARMPAKWLHASALANLAIAGALAVVNYQHWDAYRDIHHSAPRVFTNAEWGLRYYLEAAGARAVLKEQTFWPGDALVITALAAPPEGFRTTVATREVTSAIPLRIVALTTKSNYSDYFGGLRPFDISTAPIDRVSIEVVAERKVTYSSVKIGTPEAASQIVAGIYNADHWTSEQGTILLKRPDDATTVEATVFIPPMAPARTITLSADGTVLKTETYAAPGVYKISAPAPAGQTPAITLAVDKTFSSPPDTRKLGVVLLDVAIR